MQNQSTFMSWLIETGIFLPGTFGDSRAEALWTRRGDKNSQIDFGGASKNASARCHVWESPPTALSRSDHRPNILRVRRSLGVRVHSKRLHSCKAWQPKDQEAQVRFHYTCYQSRNSVRSLQDFENLSHMMVQGIPHHDARSRNSTLSEPNSMSGESIHKLRKRIKAASGVGDASLQEMVKQLRRIKASKRMARKTQALKEIQASKKVERKDVHMPSQLIVNGVETSDHTVWGDALTNLGKDRFGASEAEHIANAERLQKLRSVVHARVVDGIAACATMLGGHSPQHCQGTS